jgi:hypothetical protein
MSLSLQNAGSEPIDDSSPGWETYPGWNVGSAFLHQVPASRKAFFLLKLTTGEESREVLGWLEKKDSSTQTDLLSNEEEQAQDLIFRIRTLPFISCRESVADGLLRLLNDAREEEDYVGAGIAIGSLRSFYDFLQLNPNLKCPAISLTPEYNIYASWRDDQRLFSVHFLPDRDSRFVIFKPNDLHPERKIRISGIATTDILMKTAAPYGVYDWVSE